MTECGVRGQLRAPFWKKRMERLSELEEKRRKRLRTSPGGEEAAMSPEEEKVSRDYSAFVREERQKEALKLHSIDMEIAYEKFCLAKEQEESRKDSVNGERRSNAASRGHAMKIRGLVRQKEARISLSPDAFYEAHEQELLEDIENERKGRLVDVPYLIRAKEQIRASLLSGIPVYLVGHLGSGKTQLAVEAAGDYSRELAVQRKLSEKNNAFEKRHPAATREEKLSFFEKALGEAEKEVDSDALSLRPYFISGSHNLTAEDMFTEKTLKLTHAGEKEPDSRQLEKLISAFTDFVHQNESIMKDMNEEQKLSLLLAGWKTFSNLYISENSGFGTTVEKIDKEVLKALKEGKPVIIDEINTIAMQNLIALNDILQHHAGQTAYVTGVGPVKIGEGFCLIGTGNLSTGTVSYEGTNTLNPAFQSRFTTIVYNYVPQETKGEWEDAGEPGENELFRLIITHLCAGDGSLQLPEPSRMLRELFHLAEMARMSENIFEGRSDTVNADGDTPVLSEAVLSVRGIMHVLDLWNYGEESDLSMALWNGFLSSVTNPDDRNLLLALAAEYGFFRDEDGWQIKTRARGEGALSYEDIRTRKYEYEIKPLEKLSREDVVEILFGRGPKRKELPENLRGEILIDDAAGESSNIAESLDETVRQLEHGAEVLTNLAETDGSAEK